MEDKTFDLLSKMYGEFTDFRKEVNNEFKVTNSDIRSLKNDILRIEQNHGSNLEILFDGYRQVYDKLETVEKKVDDLSDKVDRHDIRIQVIEGGRK